MATARRHGPTSRGGRRRDVALVAVLSVGLLATTCSDDGDVGADTGGEVADGAVVDGQADDGDDDGTAGDGTGGDGTGDDGGGVLGSIDWRLTPTGPEIPAGDEREVYFVLQTSDPTRCAALLTSGALSQAPPGGFGETGPRSYHLYRAGAYLCAGDRDGAVDAYRRTVLESWPDPADPVTRGRVCAVWDEVTRHLDPAAGPCALQARDDTGTDGDDAGADDDGGAVDGDDGDADDGTGADDGTDVDGAGRDGDGESGEGEGGDGAIDDGTPDDGDTAGAAPSAAVRTDTRT
jgi:hypothetical protein